MEQLIQAEPQDGCDFRVEAIDSAGSDRFDQVIERAAPPFDAGGDLGREGFVAVVVEPGAGAGDGRRQVGASGGHGSENIERRDARGSDHACAWNAAPVGIGWPARNSRTDIDRLPSA